MHKVELSITPEHEKPPRWRDLLSREMWWWTLLWFAIIIEGTALLLYFNAQEVPLFGLVLGGPMLAIGMLLAFPTDRLGRKVRARREQSTPTPGGGER